MSLAYVILAHDQPQQVARLVERLRDGESRMFIHVDRRAELRPFHQALDPWLAEGTAVLARRRVRSRWADFSLVTATLETLEQALQESMFTHVSLLSGADYPLYPAAVLKDFFTSAGERSFMSFSAGDHTSSPDRRGNPQWYWNGDLRRLSYRHYLILGRHLQLPNRYTPFIPRHRPPADLTFYQGSQWWTLSRTAARYVIEAFVRRPELTRFFRRVEAPDENVFQMVLCSSPLRNSILNEDLRFLDWHDWHAKTLSKDDLARLTASTKLFARKFDASVEPALLEDLDRLLAERARDHEASLNALRSAHLTPAANKAVGTGL